MQHEELIQDLGVVPFSRVKDHYLHASVDEIEFIFSVEQHLDIAEVAAAFLDDVPALDVWYGTGQLRFIVISRTNVLPEYRSCVTTFDEIDEEQDCKALLVGPIYLVQFC